VPDTEDDGTRQVIMVEHKNDRAARRLQLRDAIIPETAQQRLGALEPNDTLSEDVERELKAISSCYLNLAELDLAARRRALMWLREVLRVDV
jgi:hypothetical protein